MIRVVVDTNVLMSGVFWSGTPAQILSAWYEKKLRLVISPEILNEYVRVGQILAKKFPGLMYCLF
jgi:putative PIN family toxin of toxin-antitoxin system